MVDKMPHKILDIYNKVQNNGFEIYFVGGCVRDILLNRETKDWDFATNATPQQILKLFPNGFYDNQFGTVGVPIEVKNEKEVVEITTYRTERGFKDRRHPEVVEWGKTIKEDLARRDFTINAIAIKLNKLDTHFIDPFKGRVDLNKKLIRAVGNANERFKEDALRLMRAVRFATQLGFEIEKKTWKAIIEDASLIKEISAERIRDEMFKILASNYPMEGIILLKNSGLLEYILPELLTGIGVSMARPGRHHTTDVFTHNLLALKNTPSNDPIVRLASLLHDIGKPQTAGTDKDGLIIFHNHEVASAKIARQIAERLKLSKKDKEKIINLVRWHMFTVDEKITDAAVRRFIRRVGEENVKDIVDLRIGDRLGSGTAKAESWRLRLFKKRIEDQFKPKPFSIEDMVVNGNDVMNILNIPPGRKIGEILEKLFEEVDEDLSKNTEEYLINRIREIGTNDSSK